MLKEQRNELMFIQNEFLQDIKNVENKFEYKISTIQESIDEQKTAIEDKIGRFERTLNVLMERMQKQNVDNINETLNSKILSINKKLDDSLNKENGKISSLKIDLQNAIYKYDKVIMNNFQVTGLIGDKCQYPNLREFLEYVNKTIKELSKSKIDQKNEFKFNKEKIDGLIAKNKTQFVTFENKINYNTTEIIKKTESDFQRKIDELNEKFKKLYVEHNVLVSEFEKKYNDMKENYLSLDGTLKNFIVQFEDYIINNKEQFSIIHDSINNSNGEINELNQKINSFNQLKEKYVELKNTINKLTVRINGISERIVVSQKRIANENEERKNSARNMSYMAGMDSSPTTQRTILNDESRIQFRKNFLHKSASSDYRKVSKQGVSNIVLDKDLFKSTKKSKYERIKIGAQNERQNNVDEDKKDRIFVNGYDIMSIGLDALSNILKDENDIKKFSTLQKKKKNMNEKIIAGKSDDIIVPHNHRYIYLNRKINILTSVMVENINKLIFQIYCLKKKKNNSSSTFEIAQPDNKYELINSINNKDLKKLLLGNKMPIDNLIEDKINAKTINVPKNNITKQKI